MIKNIKHCFYSQSCILIIAICFLLAGCSGDNEAEEILTEPELQPLFECENGKAGIYPCNGYDLMSRINARILGGAAEAETNDSWGWTDPATGMEYAIVGTSHGTAFVDISDPTQPVLLGRLPTATVISHWRDIKVFQNHAFIVSEAENHGMQVFDLTRLRNLINTPQNFSSDAHYTGVGSAHNIIINEISGYAYVVGSETFSGGPHFINIQDPVNPVGAGGYAAGSYTHDAQVVTYNGRDMDHRGKEIFIGSNEHGVVIVDVSNKDNPQLISEFDYERLGYPHQGWFTEDLEFFLLGDEYDEISFGINTRTMVFDFRDLDNPSVHLEYLGPTPAIDHNGYVKNDLFYLANYTAGLRIIDISGLQNGRMEETGYFDTFPGNDIPEFMGAWSVYPFFESGNIVISDIQKGLLVIRKRKI